MPAFVFAGNRIPVTASAVPFTWTVCGRSAHTEELMLLEQVRVTLPLNPLTDCASRMNPPSTTPGLTVSEPGIGVMVELVAAFTVKLCVTGVAAAYWALPGWKAGVS